MTHRGTPYDSDAHCAKSPQNRERDRNARGKLTGSLTASSPVLKKRYGERPNLLVYAASNFLVAGPVSKGKKLKGIKAVIRSETEIAFIFYRTRLFRPAPGSRSARAI